MNEDMTGEEFLQAACSLKDWCKSQGMLPHEAVLTCETFIAMMIAENGTDQENIEEKYELTIFTIRGIVERLRVLQ